MGTGKFCKAIPAGIDDGKPRYEAMIDGRPEILVFESKNRAQGTVTWRIDHTDRMVTLPADQAKRIDGSNTVTTHSCFA
jgi:hypothetical protein